MNVAVLRQYAVQLEEVAKLELAELSRALQHTVERMSLLEARARTDADRYLEQVSEGGTVDHRAVELHVGQVGPGQVGAAQIGVLQRGALEIGAGQVCVAQDGAGQDRGAWLKPPSAPPSAGPVSLAGAWQATVCRPSASISAKALIPFRRMVRSSPVVVGPGRPGRRR